MLTIRNQMILSAIALIATTTLANAQFEPGTEVPARVQLAAVEATVRIKCSGKQGSGVCIGRKGNVSYILTAEHVIRGANRLEIDVFTTNSFPQPARTFRPAFRVWSDADTDLALIAVSIPVPRSVRVCPFGTPFDTGDAVFTVGCDAGSSPYSKVCRLADMRPNGDLIVDRPCVGGRSGGGLFGPAGVMGIVSRSDRVTSITCVSPRKIHDFIEETGNAFLLP